MRVIIIGAGGHAQVVADILLHMQELHTGIQLLGYVDDEPMLTGKRLLGLPVLGSFAQLSRIVHEAVIIGIGDNDTRRRIFEMLCRQGERFVTARHPSAVIARDVSIGAGTVICAGVVVNTGSCIGTNVILNTACTVDHHSRVGDHTHIAPGVHLGGEVTIGENVLVGIGATVMPRVCVAAHSIIGAGACVTKSVPPGLTVVGIPAKPIQK